MLQWSHCTEVLCGWVIKQERDQRTDEIGSVADLRQGALLFFLMEFMLTCRSILFLMTFFMCPCINEHRSPSPIYFVSLIFENYVLYFSDFFYFFFLFTYSRHPLSLWQSSACSLYLWVCVLFLQILYVSEIMYLSLSGLFHSAQYSVSIHLSGRCATVIL